VTFTNDTKWPARTTITVKLISPKFASVVPFFLQILAIVFGKKCRFLDVIGNFSCDQLRLVPWLLRPIHLRPLTRNHVHLRPRNLRLFHLRSHSFETTFIWDHVHLKPHSFETTLNWGGDWGRFWWTRGRNNTNGDENARSLIDHWVNFSSLPLWLVSFLQMLVYYDNRLRLLLKQFLY